ncbi:interferon-induced protein with tetratricopeptide repeats 1-like [Suncus etruscus]|uniref:interferon-induced protein with tetratricopeptide repeats 1-like n=1 Tax=Suncus etruscus TaxID=109475 RepID=UPI00210FF2C1|nr:interferon-induced protein with tetratricopeptide repeats 1-like [Suncus etruscus]
MSDQPNANLIKEHLLQLKCHFTWDLKIEDIEMPDLENRIFDQTEFLDNPCKTAMGNLLAYVKYLEGKNQEALESLKEAEDFIQQEYADQADVKSLVTWGNYAWLYYHMGRLAEAQTYLDKVEKTCKKLASPFSHRIECPELDCEEGWALMKCGGLNYERAQACFKRAVGSDPEKPEYNTGYAIITYRLNNIKRTGNTLDPLKRACRLDPENMYVKVLLGLCLQDVGQEDEGEQYIEEALASKSSHTYILRYAAKFYRRKGSAEKALRLLKRALKDTPTSVLLHHQIGLCLKGQIIQQKKGSHWQRRWQNQEDIAEMAKLAITHLELALKYKPTFILAYRNLAEIYVEIGEYSKAEDTYQKALHLPMESLTKEEQQQLHYHYGQFQEFKMKSDVDAITHFLKTVKIEKASYLRDQSLSALEKHALKKLQKNESDVEGLSLLGFVQKQKGETDKALESYERALSVAIDSMISVELGPTKQQS